MSSKVIVCVACGAAVPYGRLSCPACGELLASVAGAAPRAAVSFAVGAPAAAALAPVAPAATADPAAPAAPATKRASRSSRATPSVLVDVAPAAVAVADAPMAGGPVVEADHAPDLPLAPAPAVTSAPPPAEAPYPNAGTASPDGDPMWPQERPQWREERPPAPLAQAASVSPPSVANAPGAYVPPLLPATPAGPPAPARAWAGHPNGDQAADAGSRAASASGVVVDPARLGEFIGWLAVAGSAMAAVGFLLPWGMSVIGASGVDYFDRWGMAGPFHPLVVLGVLAILVLALVPNPVPPWLRVGLPGLGFGALLLGLVWPYLLALPGTGPGVVVVALGAIILIAAGLVALVTDRHDGEARAV